MVFLSQLSFAILSTSLFLTGGSAFSDSPGHPLQLAKRLPNDWDIFNTWQENCEIYPYECSEPYDGAVGNFDKKAGTADWVGEECIEYTATFSPKPIASGLAAAIYKGSLETKKDGEVTKTQDVVFKRAPGDSSYEVLYGASLAKDLSNDGDNILAPIDYFMSNPDGRKAGNAVYPYVSGGSIESSWGSFTSQDSVNSAFKQMLAALNTVASPESFTGI
ncbi:hypothetical protein N7509_010079 [Penicillium cosmopolitanum]|uniref:Uncharacterized protein n=1 Tax=Penicillium cosmopolitanum TaxID=1131564 RepID=A0A9W9VQP4_9EURO|nr:uncharacterized protein N7509_010079 [Penicillium cosmopolitanum]KAJ5387538.1 hypothetical protein N7509_010079 [Penicillium cosmopolitanum]